MSTPQRSRRAARATGDDRQRALVEAFERLLADRALADVGVDEIASGAALSRSAFYFYFASKQAVLLELLDRMVAETDEALAALGGPGEDPAAWWRAVIGVFVEVFGAHRAVVRTLSEARATLPAVRAEWAAIACRWIEQGAATIAAEQRRGRARADLDPVATSTALNAMNERVLAASLGGEEPALPADRLLDVLTDVWVATVHGVCSPRARPCRAARSVRRRAVGASTARPTGTARRFRRGRGGSGGAGAPSPPRPASRRRRSSRPGRR